MSGRYIRRVLSRIGRGLRSLAEATARRRIPGVLAAKRIIIWALQRTDLTTAVELQRGGVLHVDLAGAVGRTIWLHRDYASESDITGVITDLLQPGDVFFDVGANVGFFTVVAARIVGPEGQVVAFEPLPRLANLLHKTVRANQLGNVEVVQAAVGERTGTSVIAEMPDSAYSHLTVGAREIDKTHGGWRAIDVRAVALDDYIAGRSKIPRLIKMDIEGSEIEALRGARSLLAHPEGPDFVCEVGGPHLARFGHSPIDLFNIFESNGYVPRNPKTRKPMQLSELSNANYNVLFEKRRDEA